MMGGVGVIMMVVPLNPLIFFRQHGLPIFDFLIDSLQLLLKFQLITLPGFLLQHYRVLLVSVMEHVPLGSCSLGAGCWVVG